jgi:hypothetical protein
MTEFLFPFAFREITEEGCDNRYRVSGLPEFLNYFVIKQFKNNLFVFVTG